LLHRDIDGVVVNRGSNENGKELPYPNMH